MVFMKRGIIIFFSNVFYANNGKVYQLDEVIESLDQKQIIIERDWPIDG